MRLRSILTAVLFAGILSGCGQPAGTPEPVSETAEPARPAETSATTVSGELLNVNTWQEDSRTLTQYELHLNNPGDTEGSDWEAVLTIPEGTQLVQLWNAKLQDQGTTWILTPESYNSTIPAGGSISDIGLIASCERDEIIQIKEVRIDGVSVQAKPAPAPTEATAGSVNTEASGALHVEGGRLCNAEGDPVQLRGISTHGLSWYPEYVNLEAFKTLRDDWNVNTIRLAMYTAEKGGYCTGGDRAKLLEVIDEGVRDTEALGMYCIIDWHILSDYDPRMHQKEAEEFFALVSEKYADRTHVLYEICNEPQQSPFQEVIRPYAEDLLKVIRANDSDAVVLVGTNTWSQNIDEVIGHQLEDANVMYTLHFYAGTHKENLRKRLVKALDAGVPVYISECSIVDASGNGKVDAASAEAWWKIIQNYGLSVNVWSLSNKNETSALISPSCTKTSGWREAELSETGRWFRNAFRQEKAQ